MRVALAAFAGIVLVAAMGCSHPIDPSAATLAGTFVKIDSTLPGVPRLGVRTSALTGSRVPPDEYEYAVTVFGKILVQTTNGFQPIALSELPLNSRVLLWTTTTESLRMIHEPITATRVVVPLP